MGVKWADRVSESFSVENGVRQGGNLSPLLFNVYIDELLFELRKLPVGCHIGKCSVNVLAYGWWLFVLSLSVYGIYFLKTLFLSLFCLVSQSQFIKHNSPVLKITELQQP